MIYQANTASSPMAKESSKLDFSVADAADNEVLNAILWKAAKGDVPMPAAAAYGIPTSSIEVESTKDE